jgi:hypothetical protein
MWVKEKVKWEIRWDVPGGGGWRVKATRFMM